MSELTDLQICKKIAEIERGEGWLDSMYEDSDLQRLNWSYNPLTDKALCFDLMVKYEIDVEYSPGCFDATCWNDSGSHTRFNENPQKAICLAIIAKHNKE